MSLGGAQPLRIFLLSLGHHAFYSFAGNAGTVSPLRSIFPVGHVPKSGLPVGTGWRGALGLAVPPHDRRHPLKYARGSRSPRGSAAR